MQLWRLSGAAFADRFDGGYGLEHAGRWNERGRPVTYCATGPALCLLEKLVHVEDASLLPDDTMLIRYHAPDDLRVEEARLAALPENWRNDQALTRRLGSVWLARAASCLLRVPSVMHHQPSSPGCRAYHDHGHRQVRVRPSTAEQRRAWRKP